jgi:hypothetical protein
VPCASLPSLSSLQILIHFVCQLNDDILTFVCQLLCHEFPRVRRCTADNLYIRLLEEPDLLGSRKHFEPALGLLLEAPWDSDMNQMEANNLSSRFAKKIGINFISKNVIDNGAPTKERIVDEFAGYASLVNSRS